MRERAETAAKWIRVAESVVPEPGTRPVYLVRLEFDVPDALGRAQLRISAQGIYSAFINGKRVGSDELTPGYTQYNQRIQIQTYEVSDLIHAGSNAIAVQLGDGWFRGCIGTSQHANHYGAHVALLAELTLRDGDGIDHVLAATCEDWRVGPSHITAADLMRGQCEDRRQFDASVYVAGFDDAAWERATSHSVTAQLVTPVAPPVRRIEAIAPASIRRLRSGAQVVDFGQNINGWVRLKNLGPAGTLITLTHGEAIDSLGDVTTANLDVTTFVEVPVICHQVDSVISAGVVGDEFEPHFTQHGFQFVRVEGLLEPLHADEIEAMVVHTDLRRIGNFTCSDERLTWLHQSAVWSFRGNASEVPTDCPTRERSGWSGDWQLFAPTAAYLYDVSAFTRKWLADVLLDQRADGAVANISPLEHGTWESELSWLNGSAGWGDVIVAAPHALYWAYGETTAIEQCWDGMRKWLAFAERSAREGRHASRTGPLQPHEQYLWDSGFHWGEWLEPNVDFGSFEEFLTADKSEVATAYLYRSAAQMAELGRVIGRPDDEIVQYLTLATNVQDAWQREFIDGDGHVRIKSQAAHVRALHFGLASVEHRAGIASDLVQLIRDAGTHLGTGFLSTPYLLPVLAEYGYADVAYELLFQDTQPSWMYMRAMGATTMWESWNGIDAAGIPHESLNHYSKGAVISFLHQYVAGLRAVEPGYREFRVEPVIGGGVSQASTSQITPHGEIRVDWSVIGQRFSLEVFTPDSCEGTALLPDGTESKLVAGTVTLLECPI